MAMQNELAPNTSTNHQHRMAYLPTGLLDKTITGPIFDKAQQDSLILRMAERIPVSFNETVIPVTTKLPEAGQVGVGKTNAQREGYAKPVSGIGWDTKSLQPIKLAVIVTASEEFARTNPRGLWGQVQPQLSRAIGRAIDEAVFHGKSPLTGGNLAGISSTDVLKNTTNSVYLDPTANLNTLLMDGYDLVSDDFEFNAWAVDPRYRTRLARAAMPVDSNGDPTDPNGVNLGASQSNVLGLNAQYGRAVGGDLGAATDSGIRVIGGDFSQVRVGFADEIRFKYTDQATLTDGTNTINLWQTNQVAILCECTFGWIVGDLDAFVAFTTVDPTP